MNVTIADYGIGNLRPIEKAFEKVGASVVRTDDPDQIEESERLVVPGVGAFGACATEIRRRGLFDTILRFANSGRPLLGVCVGMQLLFEYSEELGRHEGFGLLTGGIRKLDIGDQALKIPHMGWNTVEFDDPDHGLFAGIDSGSHFYFVHSFAAFPGSTDSVIGQTKYGNTFPTIVARDNVMGVQFHPEKSQANGLRLLENFSKLPVEVLL